MLFLSLSEELKMKQILLRIFLCGAEGSEGIIDACDRP